MKRKALLRYNTQQRNDVLLMRRFFVSRETIQRFYHETFLFYIILVTICLLMAFLFVFHSGPKARLYRLCAAI